MSSSVSLECGWYVPSNVWSHGGHRILKPFLVYDLVPHVDDGEDRRRKLRACGSRRYFLRLTPSSSQRHNASHPPGFTFLFSCDWSLLQLGYLLYSETYPVWPHLPSDWDASETDVVWATLILTHIVREAMLANGAPTFAMNRTEVTFSCMKVFVLEYGQAQGVPSVSGEGHEEAFREGVEGKLMA
jgi:RNA polymerase II-associated protein 1